MEARTTVAATVVPVTKRLLAKYRARGNIRQGFIRFFQTILDGNQVGGDKNNSMLGFRALIVIQ